MSSKLWDWIFKKYIKCLHELTDHFKIKVYIYLHHFISGPRNYGKSIEWKLEGDPWVSEGLYSDNTRGIYLLCLILQVRYKNSKIHFFQ